MSDDKPDPPKAETERRFVASRASQIGTGNLAGLSFGNEKWKYPYEATVEHPGEFIRRAEGGFGVTKSTADAVYGKPDKDQWADGPVQGIMQMFFTPEGPGHGTGGGSKYSFLPSQDEFRKNSPPMPLLTKFTGIGFGLGAIHVGIMRYSMRLPMYASVHRAVFTCTFYAWAGYQIQKLITMKNMGQYKYSVDFAGRHSDIIFKQQPTRFGDPEILEHYIKMGGKGHTG